MATYTGSKLKVIDQNGDAFILNPVVGNGDVTGPSSSTDDHVATFDGVTGKQIKDSGFTIGKSVPADAVFTDTKYNLIGRGTGAGLAPGLPSGTGTTKYLCEDGGWAVPPNDNTTYSMISRSSGPGLAPGLPSGTGTAQYLREDGAWAQPPNDNTTYSFSNNAPTLAWNATSTVGTVGGVNLTVKMPPNPDTNTTYAVVAKGSNGLCPALPNETTTTKYLRQDGSWVTPPDNNTTYAVVAKGSNGLCPALPNETATTKYLRQDGSWVTPPDNNTTYAFSDKNVTLAWSTTHTIATVGGTNIRVTMPANPNTTYSTVSKTAAGLCPQLPNETTTTKYLRQDGTWVKPPNDNTTYSFTDKNVTLAWSTTHTIATVGGTNIRVTMPAKPSDTNTTYSFTDKNVTLAWGTTHTIAVVGGVNIRLTMPAKPADTNTWRGIQNNLTSTSTTDSLSAYQGKLLNDNKQDKLTDSGWKVLDSTYRVFYRKYGNIVTVMIDDETGRNAGAITISTALPSGYRPYVLAMASVGYPNVDAAPSYMQVNTSGQVAFERKGYGYFIGTLTYIVA